MGKYALTKFKNGWLLSLLFAMAGIYAGLGQQYQAITGTVTGESDGSPIPGVAVVVQGTTVGTITDFDGTFTINAASDAVLVFSYLGFKSETVALNGRSTVNITLEEDTQALDEVVVVGYGTQKKSDLTGSVSIVDVGEAKKVITPDVAKMLQGQAPGVTVQSSGEPGGFVNIKIRGITSFNNNNPLFVIDGVIVDS